MSVEVDGLAKTYIPWTIKFSQTGGWEMDWYGRSIVWVKNLKGATLMVRKLLHVIANKVTYLSCAFPEIQCMYK